MSDGIICAVGGCEHEAEVEVVRNGATIWVCGEHHQTLFTWDEELLLHILNKAWKTLPPVQYKDFNFKVASTDQESLLAIKKDYDELTLCGLSVEPFADVGVGISCLSVISTITRLLTRSNRVLSAVVEMKDGKPDIIKEWKWWTEP